MAKPKSPLSYSLTAAERLALLNCRRLPARLDVAQAAALLNFGEHDIRFLAGNGLLPPLGKPAANAPKFFAAAEVAALAENRDWLEKATKAISGHWREKNARSRGDHNAETVAASNAKRDGTSSRPRESHRLTPPAKAKRVSPLAGSPTQ
jgi:hypothetical protein